MSGTFDGNELWKLVQQTAVAANTLHTRAMRLGYNVGFSTSGELANQQTGPAGQEPTTSYGIDRTPETGKHCVGGREPPDVAGELAALLPGPDPDVESVVGADDVSVTDADGARHTRVADIENVTELCVHAEPAHRELA
jgi:hypothetical protein